MVEYFTAEHESVGVAYLAVPCLAVSQGNKHAPHIHDRFGTGDGACSGYPAQQLYCIPRV